jgi:methyltransferase (TIGR00027 family)
MMLLESDLRADVDPKAHTTVRRYMDETGAEQQRGPSRSAALVAACRMLAAELPDSEALVNDPYAHLVADEASVAAARVDEPLQNTIRLRSKYIDDAVIAFAGTHRTERGQMLLLGAGLDARAFRLALDINVYEIDFPETLTLKAELFGDIAPLSPRAVVPVDMAEQSFVGPLVNAGFDVDQPTIVVWEGVINYLTNAEAESVVEQIGTILAPGGQLVADYVELSWFKKQGFDGATKKISAQLSNGGEPLKAGLRDAAGTLDRFGFDVIDDEAVEDLRPRYGLDARKRFYPARIFTASRRP